MRNKEGLDEQAVMVEAQMASGQAVQDAWEAWRDRTARAKTSAEQAAMVEAQMAGGQAVQDAWEAWHTGQDTAEQSQLVERATAKQRNALVYSSSLANNPAGGWTAFR